MNKIQHKKIDSKIPENLRNRHRNRHRKRNLFNYRLRLLFKYFIFFALIATVGTAISLAIFFKIEKIEVLGESRYTSEEIIKSSKVKSGQNLILLNEEKAKETVERELPFLKVNNIKKTVPNKLTFEVAEVKKYAYIDLDEMCVVFDEDKKIIEIEPQAEENLLKIKGVEVSEPKVGEKLKIKSENKGKSLYEILDLLKEYGLTEPTEVDLSNELKVGIEYQNRINILIGNLNELDYKIKTAAEIVNNRLSKDESGELDLSMLDQGDTSYFRLKNKLKS